MRDPCRLLLYETVKGIVGSICSSAVPAALSWKVGRITLLVYPSRECQNDAHTHTHTHRPVVNGSNFWV